MRRSKRAAKAAATHSPRLMGYAFFALSATSVLYSENGSREREREREASVLSRRDKAVAGKTESHGPIPSRSIKD